MNRIKALSQHPKFKELQAVSQRLNDQIAEQQARVESLQGTVTKTIVTRGHDLREAGIRLCETSGEQLITGLAARVEPHAGRHPAIERLVSDLEQMKSQHLSLCAELNAPPLEDFNALTAKKISEQVVNLPLWKVEAVRRYEMSTKNRVTVLRACEARFAA